jgi:two-component system cell cycle sensor histidine kinase/response regulator CckA
LIAPGGFFEEANHLACEMLGYTPEELLHIAIGEIVEEADIEASPPPTEAFFAKGKRVSHRRLRRKDGTSFPAEISTTLLEDHHALAIVRDITGQVLASRTGYGQLCDRNKDNGNPLVLAHPYLA